ncbi:MAG: DUF3857 domain-containing protein [Ignavibacteria bacterium]|nr:DUF3857 domain-containing protein [Ignavibacteria bacterium]
MKWTLTINLLLILACVLFISTTHVTAQETTTESGWNYLIKNDDVSAIDHFTRSVAAHPADIRAWLGLSFAYDLSLDDSASWDAYNNALQVSNDPYPYLYASFVTRRFLNQANRPTSGVSAWLERVIAKPDSLGILQTMAYEHLAGIAERTGNIPKAKELYSKIGAVTEWRLIGPFYNVSGAGYDRIFPPRQEDDTNGVYDGLSGVKVRWQTPKLFRNDYWIDYARYFPSVFAAFYATTYAWSDVEQRVHMRIGTSGGFKLIVNDSLVHGTPDEHNNDLDTYITEVTLNKGWNRILIKNTNSELGRCNFLFRITDKHGQPLSNIKYSSEKHEYQISDPQAKIIANPFVDFFKGAIQNNPKHLENYFLLTESLLRNDESMEAEKVIRRALAIAPDCLVTLNLAGEAYSRGSKFDELQATAEKMSSLRPDLPASLSYTFRQAMTADRIDDAEQIVVVMRDVMPLTVDYFDAAIEMAQKRDRMQVFNAIVDLAFTLHPDNYRYATLAAVLTLKGKERYKGAIEVMKRHLDATYSEQGLLVLANLYKDSGNFADYEKTFAKLVDFSPAAPGYYSILADMYSGRKDFEKAMESMKKAIAIAPGVSSQWYKAGVICRSVRQLDNAVESFKNAIYFDPSNFDAREALRDVLQIPSPFTLMPSTNIEALIASAPTAAKYPNSKAVYLMDDTRRVVYDGSNCEVVYEILLRVFTSAGIDQYKEMNLPGAGTASFTVDKAVVRKPNGKEIPADRQGSLAVFKSLEPGDFIYIKTKTRESSYGEMAKQFFDEKLFNTFVPVESCTYSMIVPEGQSFNWSMTNTSTQPTTTSTRYGELHVWKMVNLPEMIYEEGMPSMGDAGVVLQISSFKTWGDIVMWYSDIARAKIKPSLEVSDLMDELFPKDVQHTEEEIITGVYQYITSEIRYSNVPFRQSGVVPQKARDVLATRIGDCKDVATLCISMLAERGIDSYHVLVQTHTSPLQRNLLPSIPFDHAIVLVESESGPLFLDLTATDMPIRSLPSADVDALALIIKPGWIIPITLHRKQLATNNVYVKSKIDLLPNLSAKINQVFTFTGAHTQPYRSSWKEKTIADIERSVLEDLSQRYANVTLDNFEVDDLIQLSPRLTYSVSYTVPDFLREAGEFLIMDVPWFDKNLPETALGYTKRNYPYVFKSNSDTLSESMQISIPSGYVILGGQNSFKSENNVFSYSLNSVTDKSTFNVTRTNVWKSDYVMPTNYEAYKSEYNQIVKSDKQSILFAPKGTVVRTPKIKK